MKNIFILWFLKFYEIVAKMENQQKCKKEWEKLRISKKWLKTDKIIIILTPINKKNQDFWRKLKNNKNSKKNEKCENLLKWNMEGQKILMHNLRRPRRDLSIELLKIINLWITFSIRGEKAFFWKKVFCHQSKT